jgi:hypothetical protein
MWGCLMRKPISLLVPAIILVFFVAAIAASADRTWKISSPRGGKVTLVLTDGALQNFRIYDLEFLDNGDRFAITAEPARPTQSAKTLQVEFYDGNTYVQSGYAYIGPEKTDADLSCPAQFDRIVIQYSGY